MQTIIQLELPLKKDGDGGIRIIKKIVWEIDALPSRLPNPTEQINIAYYKDECS